MNDASSLACGYQWPYSAENRAVHRSVVLDPRVPFRDGTRIRGELLGKAGVEQAGVARAAAVVQQRDDRPDAQLAQTRERRVREAPVSRP